MFPKTLAGFYWSVIRRFPFYFIATFIVGGLVSLMDVVVFPYTHKWAVQIFQGFADGIIVPQLFWTIVLYILLPIAVIARDWIGAYGEPIVKRYTETTILRRIYENDIGFFINKSTGQIITQAEAIYGNILNLTVLFYRNVVTDVFGVVILSGAVMGLNWRVGILLLGMALGRGLWTLLRQGPINRAVKKLQGVKSGLNGIITDSLDNAVTVKMSANTDVEARYIYDRESEYVRQIHRIAFLRRIQNIPTEMAWFGFLIAIISVCGFVIFNGEMTVADGVFAVAAARSVAGLFERFLERIKTYTEQRAAARQAWGDIIRPIAVSDAPHAKRLSARDAGIDFDDVAFDYGRQRVINHFNLNINPHEKIGIVGLSGAGKTTLVNLLMRAYDVKSGAIRIGGMDVRDVTLDSLRRSIALVPQDLTLFNRSLMDNIRYARPGASRRDVMNAARLAHIHDFIASLPDGYDTLVGNRGIKLSGGQRQRIAIARAILKDAPILILDEATSALDSKNEVAVQSALNRVMRGRTTIAIAHRLSTLRHMDRIIVLSGGKIIESGTHSQLLRRGGAYKKLWDMQTGGFIG